MQSKRNGFSLIELLIVVAIILIIAAISIPNLLRSKMSANEASAVDSLNALNVACVTYSASYTGYPSSLSVLAGEGSSSLPASTSAELIDNVLQTDIKSGYSFTPGTADSMGYIETYTITASPITESVTGIRYFYTDETDVIRASSTGTTTSANTPISRLRVCNVTSKLYDDCSKQLSDDHEVRVSISEPRLGHTSSIVKFATRRFA